MNRLRSTIILLTGSTLAAACGDSPSNVPTATNMVLNRTLPGAVTAGSTISLSFLLTDSDGSPVSGAEVTLDVTGGGGNVDAGTVATNASGIATVSGWTLGPDLVSNTLVVRHGSLSPLTVTVWGCATFCIDIRFVGTPTGPQRAAFMAARQRWEEVITGDLPSIQLSVPADVCEDVDGNVVVETPAINEVIDDLVVYVQIDTIDGPGDVLGSAGPCFIRSTSRLPLFGVMLLDNADLVQLEEAGFLGDVVLHELGHTLGFPALWSDSTLAVFLGLEELLLQDEGTNDPYFTGTVAASQFELAGGTLVNGVPVENEGEAGSRDSHWRDMVMSNELMTSLISGAGNPLSTITIGSLEDIGYEVDFEAADPYMLPGAGPLTALRGRPQFEIVERRLAPPRIAF